MKWVFSKRVVHTVTFLAPGQTRPSLEQPDPANPYTGFNDSTGAPFWFNGQPSLLIPPDHAFPQGGARPRTARRTTTPACRPRRSSPTSSSSRSKGTFKYICLVHPGMVREREGACRSPRRSRRPRRTAAPGSPSSSDAVKRSKTLGDFHPTRQQRGRRPRQGQRVVVPVLPRDAHDQGRPVRALLDLLELGDPHDDVRAAAARRTS